LRVEAWQPGWHLLQREQLELLGLQWVTLLLFHLGLLSLMLWWWVMLLLLMGRRGRE
jgi:hypothetical protein